MENNRLIVEFMGLKPKLISPDVYGISMPPWIAVTGDTPEKIMDDFCKSTRYHFSWNWLMPVIEKMNNTGDAWDEYSISHLAVCLVSVDIQATYNEVVKFIKWYNTRGKKIKNDV